MTPRPQTARLALVENWRKKAACAHLHLPAEERVALFFAPVGERSDERKIRDQQARAVCAVCPVIDECTKAGEDEEGRWGDHVREGRAEPALAAVVVRKLPVKYVWCEGCQSPFWTMGELRVHQFREGCGRRKFVTG